MDIIYVPMTCNILVVGHIKLLKKLQNKGYVIVGLLTKKALQGYKKEIIPYKNRLEILKSLNLAMDIVPQNSLNPFKNLVEYECDVMASGDGFEEVEKKACRELNVKMININSGSKIHSSDICK